MARRARMRDVDTYKINRKIIFSVHIIFKNRNDHFPVLLASVTSLTCK